MPEFLGYQFDRVYAGAIERYRVVATIAERDAIPTGKRYEGMLCYVIGDQDYQLRGGTSNAYWISSAAGNYFDLTNNDSDDIIEGIVHLFLTAAERTILSYLTVTSPINLNTLASDVASLSSGLTPKGDWDASVGTFPGGGTAAVGDVYYVSVAGTVDSVTFDLGDTVIAKVLNASTTVYAGNWIRVKGNNKVTSVVSLTGAITKSALLAALNVEDGATADMTGAEIASAITTYLTTSNWQTQRTDEEIMDVIGGAFNAGTQTRITVTYDDANDRFDFTVDPFIQIYANLTTLVAGQASQFDDVLYEVTDATGSWGLTSGRAWVRWKGTTAGTAADYILVSSEQILFNSPLTTKGDLLTYDTDNVRLPIGADGQVLTADSTDPKGVKWSAVSGTGDVAGPASAVDSNFAAFDLTTGKLIKDSGIAFIDEDTMASDSATKVPSQQSVKAYVDAVAGLPVIDTTAIVKGSVDATKLVRFEVDGLTTGTTRVITVPDEDFTLNTIKSVTAGEPTGSDQVTNVVSLTQAEYDAGTPVAGTFYIITDSKENIVLPIYFSDTSTVITTGTAKQTFYMPFAMTLTEVRATLATADNALFTIDINEGGASIFSTLLTIDSGETTSQTATTAAVISDPNLADWAKITIDVDTAGTAAVNGCIYLIGTTV